MTISHYWDGGEGCSKQPWFGTEAAFDALALTELMQAKPHGKALQQGSGPWDVNRHISEITPVQKRSLKRAYRRSINSGCAWYRGRCLLPDQFPIELRKPIVSSTKPHIKHPTAKRTFAPKYRAQIGHVNVGGIATARLQEVKTWALEAEIDVLILSETRWSFSAEWSDNMWHHVHTGSNQDRSDGILFFNQTLLVQP